MRKEFNKIKTKLIFGSYNNDEEKREDMEKLNKIICKTKNRKFECEVAAIYMELYRSIEE